MMYMHNVVTASPHDLISLTRFCNYVVASALSLMMPFIRPRLCPRHLPANLVGYEYLECIKVFEYFILGN